jgi:hypothetical protein
MSNESGRLLQDVESCNANQARDTATQRFTKRSQKGDRIMPKYEAVINLTAQAVADNLEHADEAFLGELTNKLLEITGDKFAFDLWVEVIDIEETT